MAKRAKMQYVPPIVINEVENIMKDQNISIGSEGYKALADYAKVGRRIEKMLGFDFQKKKIKG